MLVLTRRSKDKIVFPQLDVSIHFIRIQSGQVKVGVDAPREIKILRDELVDSVANTNLESEQQLGALPKDVRHGIRNELHQVSVGLHLYKELMSASLVDEAAEVFTQIQNALERLDHTDALSSPSESPGLAASPLSARKSGTVLLVEDQANEREMLANILRRRELDVSTRANGTEAIRYFRDHPAPSYLLLDMQMPECDGARTIQTLLAENQLQQTTVFVVSGSSPNDYGRPISDHVQQWFPKPLDPSVLIEAMTFSQN